MTGTLSKTQLDFAQTTIFLQRKILFTLERRHVGLLKRNIRLGTHPLLLLMLEVNGLKE